jgi:hypothetical protein
MSLLGEDVKESSDPLVTSDGCELFSPQESGLETVVDARFSEFPPENDFVDHVRFLIASLNNKCASLSADALLPFFSLSICGSFFTRVGWAGQGTGS